MCYRLFIASDHPLPLIAQTAPTPTFGTDPIEPGLTLPFPAGWQIVDAGSNTGCACGFHSEGLGGRQPLADYLRPLVARQALMLYSTWHGDEALPHEVQPSLAVDGLLHHDDPIPHQTLTTIA